MYVIQAKQLKKSFSAKSVLNEINFNLKKGEIVALLGPNGAGKTRLMEILIGLQKPDSGNLEIIAKNKIGSAPQESELPENFTVSEILNFISAHFPNPKSVNSVSEALGINHLLSQKTNVFSGGQKRIISLALAMIGNPDLLILDEPTVALDPLLRKQIWNVIRQIKNEGKSVLFSTHQLDEAEYLADRIIVMNKGKIIEEGSPKSVREKFGIKSVKFKSNSSIYIDGFSMQKEGDNYSCRTQNSDQLVKELVSKYEYRELEIMNIELEEVLNHFWLKES